MENNKGKVIAFIILFCILVVGGYILTKVTEPQDNTVTTKKIQKKETKEIRIDNTKEYIYFENSETVIDELDIAYMDVVINFKTSSDIASELNSESKKFKSELKYDEQLEDAAYNKLAYAHYKKYDIYTYGEYISLVVNYYTYTPDALVQYETTKAYVFDKNTGDLLDKAELLKRFNLDEQSVKTLITNYVKDQDILKEDQILDAGLTVEGVDLDNLYVDKIGNFSISVLVKSDLKDYNDVIILNTKGEN